MKTNYSKYGSKNFKEKEFIEKKEEPMTEESDHTEIKDEIKMGYVNCDRLYIRQGPGKDYDPITDIKKNDEIMIVSGFDNDSEWYEICSASGKDGFVMKEFIDVE